MTPHYRNLCTRVASRLQAARHNDRGDIPAQVAWAGLGLMLAVAAMGLISGKVTDFINGLNFGG